MALVFARVEETNMPAACPACGNERSFLVKTLQMHVVTIEGKGAEVAEESQPAVIEVMCDECEAAMPFDAFDDDTRRDILLVLGAR